MVVVHEKHTTPLVVHKIGSATHNALKRHGHTDADWRRAQQYFEDRGFHLAYGGIGGNRGHFHVSGFVKGPEKVANWVSWRSKSPRSIFEAPDSDILRVFKQMEVPAGASA